MNLRRIVLASLLATLPLTACAGGDSRTLIEDGHRALSTGDHKGALAKFEEATSKLDPAAPRYAETKFEAKFGRVRAEAYIDAAAAKRDFLALTQEHAVTAEQYRQVVGELGAAKAFEEAVAVIEAGKKAHPDDPKWRELIQTIGDEVKRAGDTESLDALKGLGYIGGD